MIEDLAFERVLGIHERGLSGRAAALPPGKEIILRAERGWYSALLIKNMAVVVHNDAYNKSVREFEGMNDAYVITRVEHTPGQLIAITHFETYACDAPTVRRGTRARRARAARARGRDRTLLPPGTPLPA